MVFNPNVYNFGWVSWGSILAGAVIAIAIWIIMCILSLALGFKVMDPKSEHPVHGLGMTMGGWHAASVVVSLAGGGFMAGMLAGQRGLAHGLLVWAVVTIILVLVSGHAVSLAVRGIFSTVQGIGSGAAGLAGLAASAGRDAAHSAAGVLSHVKDSFDFDLDLGEIGDKLNDNLTAVLEDTGNEKLRPEYLKNQFREARRDLKKLIRQISLEPTQAENLFNAFMESVKGRIKDLTEDIDRDTAVTTLMNQRDIPRDEAETIVDNALAAYSRIVIQAREKFDDLEEQIDEVGEELKEMANRALDKADQVTSSAAKGASAVAAALIIAALLSMGFGAWGAHCAAKWSPHSAAHRYVTTR